MGMPNIDIRFQSTAQTLLPRLQAGVVAVILRDAAASGPVTIRAVKQIPESLTAANQNYLRRAFIGYDSNNPVKKVTGYVLSEEAALGTALDWLATQQFDFLAGPPEITVEECAAVKTWLLEQRGDADAIYAAVLPNFTADHEAVINFVTGGIRVGSEVYSAAAYCSRIAGMLASTPAKVSCSYADLPEVEDVERLSKSAMDDAVDAGKFLLFFNGKSVKTGRAVNSLQTVRTEQSEACKKIRIVRAMDLMQADLRSLCQDWIGTHANGYDERVLLLTAVKNYLTTLENSGVLQQGCSSVEVDLEAVQAWLEEHGTDTSAMTDEEIRQADTGSEVFLVLTVRILDSIEDIRLTIRF